MPRESGEQIRSAELFLPTGSSPALRAKRPLRLLGFSSRSPESDAGWLIESKLVMCSVPLPTPTVLAREVIPHDCEGDFRSSSLCRSTVGRLLQSGSVSESPPHIRRYVFRQPWDQKTSAVVSAKPNSRPAILPLLRREKYRDARAPSSVVGLLGFEPRTKGL